MVVGGRAQPLPTITFNTALRQGRVRDTFKRPAAVTDPNRKNKEKETGTISQMTRRCFLCEDSRRRYGQSPLC